MKEILIWRDKTYQDIPKDDNPQTYGDETIMVCLKQKCWKYEIFDIIETGKNNHPIKRAEVYDYDIARKIAKALAN